MNSIQKAVKAPAISSPVIVLIASLICFAAGCSQTAPARNPAGVDHQVPDELEDLFSETRQSIRDFMAERGWPGVAIAVSDRERVLWSETFGMTERDTGAVVTPATVFSVGSITKTVTATAVMLAVQDELVDLDTPITAYLPEFTVNSSFEDRPEQRITLRHLLDHTAGFTHEAPVGNNFNPASPSWRAHVASISDTWLKFPVGERYSYSNLGIETAAFIVQEVSGVPFETFVQRRIFEPLGMRSSFVNTPARNGNCDACAKGHNRWFTSLPTYIPMEGAGGLRMTLDDAVRYVQFHLNRGRVGDEQVLATRFFDAMYRPSVEITSSEPMLRYGMGFYLWGNFAETYSVHHQGTGFGFSASTRWYPEYGIGMVLLLNTVDRGPDWDVGTSLLMAMIKKRLAIKTGDRSVPDADRFYEQVDATKRRHPLTEPGETPYREEWEEYIGTYCAAYGGAYVLDPDVETSSVCFRIFEQDGYLSHSGGLHDSGHQRTQRLIEHEPGLFFAEQSGEALDLRSDPPTFRNIGLHARE